jgi:glycerol-3-phosphate acyltransferase PlsY
MTVGRTALAATLGYLAGSIPSADIATRLARAGVDLRSTGSGNPGAMNAASILGPGWGAAVLAADMAKGTLGAMVGRAVGGDAGAYAAATSAIAGHIAPVWSGFRGGKGVATSAGASLAVFPVYAPVDVAVATVGALRSRRAQQATQLACAAWVAAAVVTWRKGLPNAWGPAPGPGLPLFAAAGSAMILAKFASTRRRAA